MAPSNVARRKPQVSAEDTAAFGPIAERFRRAGDLERAISLCREGLQKFPDHISARATLGWALLELGKFNEARTELETVLRRAPDNLSAIRGLAELHDRSEHTMDLPMDGPGQWPPDAETLDQMDRAVAVTGDDAATAGDIVDEAVWAPVISEPTGPAFIAPPELGLAMWSAVSPAEPPAALDTVDTEAFDPAPTPSPIASASVIDEIDELDADCAPATAEVDLAALIAQADSLEAAADVDAHASLELTEPALVLDAAVDLSAFEDVGLVVPAELTAGFDAPVELTAGEDAVAEPEPEILSAPMEPAFDLTAPDETTESWTLEALNRAQEATALFEGSVPPAVAAESPQALDFESVRSPIAALERFLVSVQARRRQVVAESVA